MINDAENWAAKLGNSDSPKIKESSELMTLLIKIEGIKNEKNLWNKWRVKCKWPTFAKTFAKTFTKVSVFEESFGFQRKLRAGRRTQAKWQPKAEWHEINDTRRANDHKWQIK
jgi:hypothetical protein